MRVNHFTEAGLVLKDPEIKRDQMRDQILAAYLSMVDDAGKGEGFFSESDTVKAIYMTSWETPVPEILSACSIVSDMHSRRKRQSATKDPLVKLGHYASTYMLSMPVKNFNNNPDLGDISYQGQNKFPAKKDKKDLSDFLNWNGDRTKLSNKIPLTGMLYGKPFEAYCMDSFWNSDSQHLLNVFESFGVKTTEAGRYERDESVKLKPPFRVSWEAMAVHAARGKHQRATVEMVNKWMLVPKFMHVITAHKKHEFLIETPKNEVLHRQVLYAMRHHVHNHSASNLGAHPCMKMIYNFQTQPQCLPTSSHTVMHALLYLAEVVNAFLTDKALHDPLENIENKKAYLSDNVKYVAALFSTLNQNAFYPGLDNMVVGLGKSLLSISFYILYFFH